MKRHLPRLVFLFIVICFLASDSPAQQITQHTGNVAGVPGIDTGHDPTGGYVCVGTIRNVQGMFQCNGQLVAASAFAAVYAKGVFDRLNDTNTKLATLELKLQESAAASEKTRLSIEKLVVQMSEAIQEIVKKRFETLPADLLNDPVVKERFKKLQEDIIKDIKDSLSTPTNP